MADPRPPLLEVRNLTAGYVPEVDILSEVHLTVDREEMVTVVGPNGAGKSTLVKCMVGVLPPRQGQIRFDGEELVGVQGHRIARMGLGYVPQRDNVFPSLTVGENLEMGLAGRSRAAVQERLDLVYQLFPRLKERRRQQAGTLSGGERQMVAIGRALMGDPHMLALDEPSVGLAPALVEVIFERILAINRSGVAVLMVEQNARQALSLSHRGYVLDLGRNRFEGPGPELLAHPQVAELYLGGSTPGYEDSRSP